MDADSVIRVPQCLSNRARPVYTFDIGYLGQHRGQRSWSAKNAINFLNCDIRYSFKLKMRPNQCYFNVNLCEEDVE